MNFSLGGPELIFPGIINMFIPKTFCWPAVVGYHFPIHEILRGIGDKMSAKVYNVKLEGVNCVEGG